MKTNRYELLMSYMDGLHGASNGYFAALRESIGKVKKICYNHGVYYATIIPAIGICGAVESSLQIIIIPMKDENIEGLELRIQSICEDIRQEFDQYSVMVNRVVMEGSCLTTKQNPYVEV